MMKQLVYVGPDLPGISARYTVYNNGLPKALEEHIKTKPVFRSLVVPVERLAQVNMDFAAEGSAINTFYRKACETM